MRWLRHASLTAIMDGVPDGPSSFRNVRQEST